MFYKLSYVTCSRFFIMTLIWPLLTSVASANPTLVTPAYSQSPMNSKTIFTIPGMAVPSS